MKILCGILVLGWALIGCATSKNSQLIVAAKDGDETEVRQLLQEGADVENPMG